jgi:hypothetical protein
MNAIVRDVMTPDVITVGKDTSFEVIAAACASTGSARSRCSARHPG